MQGELRATSCWRRGERLMTLLKWRLAEARSRRYRISAAGWTYEARSLTSARDTYVEASRGPEQTLSDIGGRMDAWGEELDRRPAFLPRWGRLDRVES